MAKIRFIKLTSNFTHLERLINFMKRAKQKFDELIEKAKSGKEVTFGQMEKLYAEAFIERFVKDLDKNRKNLGDVIKKIKMIQVAEENEMEVEEVDPDQVDVGEEEKVLFEMEIIRSVVGVLGTSPPISMLHRYIGYAMREGRQQWLNDMVSLLPTDMKGYAISLVASGRFYDYFDLEHNYGIKFDIDEKDVQRAYRKIVDECGLMEASRRIKSVSQHFGIKPDEGIEAYMEETAKNRYDENERSISDELKKCVETGSLTNDVISEAEVIYGDVSDIHEYFTHLEPSTILNKICELYSKNLSSIINGCIVGLCRGGEMPVLQEAIA